MQNFNGDLLDAFERLARMVLKERKDVNGFDLVCYLMITGWNYATSKNLEWTKFVPLTNFPSLQLPLASTNWFSWQSLGSTEVKNDGNYPVVWQSFPVFKNAVGLNNAKSYSGLVDWDRVRLPTAAQDFKSFSNKIEIKNQGEGMSLMDLALFLICKELKKIFKTNKSDELLKTAHSWLLRNVYSLNLLRLFLIAGFGVFDYGSFAKSRRFMHQYVQSEKRWDLNKPQIESTKDPKTNDPKDSKVPKDPKDPKDLKDPNDPFIQLKRLAVFLAQREDLV